MHTAYAARAFAAGAFMLFASGAMAQTTLAPRDVPAKTIPVPTDVSPQLQALIAKPLLPDGTRRRRRLQAGSVWPILKPKRRLRWLGRWHSGCM